MTKPWYRSITLWVAILSLASFALTLVLDQAGVLELSPKAIAILGIVESVLMAALRWLRQNPPLEGSPPARQRSEE